MCDDNGNLGAVKGLMGSYTLSLSTVKTVLLSLSFVLASLFPNRIFCLIWPKTLMDAAFAPVSLHGNDESYLPLHSTPCLFLLRSLYLLVFTHYQTENSVDRCSSSILSDGTPINISAAVSPLIQPLPLLLNRVSIAAPITPFSFEFFFLFFP